MRAGRLAERPYDVPQRIVIPNLTGMIVNGLHVFWNLRRTGS